MKNLTAKLNTHFNLFFSRTIVNLKKVNMFVAISYFHRKIGPLVFYSYPKNSLDKDLSGKIANIMDQQFNEGFFTHSFENLNSMNYYFEIQSDWASGNKEILMVSIIIYQQISPEIEESVASLCRKFAEMMQSNEDIYSGFYINKISDYDDVDRERIKKNEGLIKDEIKDLYWETVEETRKKSEEMRRFRNLETEKQLPDAERFPFIDDLRPVFKVFFSAERLDTKRIDPKLKGNIQAFLDWVKDPEGLAGYVSYYLQQNDPQVISKLSKIYNELKNI